MAQSQIIELSEFGKFVEISLNFPNVSFQLRYADRTSLIESARR